MKELGSAFQVNGTSISSSPGDGTWEDIPTSRLKPQKKLPYQTLRTEGPPMGSGLALAPPWERAGSRLDSSQHSCRQWA